MKKIVSILVLTAVIAATGCNPAKTFENNGADNEEAQPISGIALEETQTDITDGMLSVRLYFAQKDNNTLAREVRYISKDDALKSVNNLAKRILDELLSGPDAKSDVTAVIPPEIKQIDVPKLDVATGILTINLPGAFAESFADESTEKMVIASIVNSLTEIKEVNGVTILIDGKTGQSMKNGISLAEPFKRDVTLIAEIPGVNDSDDAEVVIYDDIDW